MCMLCKQGDLKVPKSCHGWVAQLVGALTHTPKCCGFDSQSGHTPRLQVQSPIMVMENSVVIVMGGGEYKGGKW